MANRNTATINRYAYIETSTIDLMDGKQRIQKTYMQTFVNLRTPDGVIIRRNLNTAKQHVQILLRLGYTLTLEKVTGLA